MIITINSSKGGAGSTTMLLLLAHYLGNQHEQVYLIDLTSEQSLVQLHLRSLLLEERLPFEFFSSSLSKSSLLIDRLEKQQNALLLLDLPKLSNDELLQSLYLRVERFVVPFQYGMLGISTSIYYASSISKAYPLVPLIFICNDLFSYQRNHQSDDQLEALRVYGKISPGISHMIPLSALNTLQISPACIFECKASLEVLNKIYLCNY